MLKVQNPVGAPASYRFIPIRNCGRGKWMNLTLDHITPSVQCRSFLGHADPRMTSRGAHVGDMAKRNSALFIRVKVGGA